jgi:hypothetical protein
VAPFAVLGLWPELFLMHIAYYTHNHRMIVVIRFHIRRVGICQHRLIRRFKQIDRPRLPRIWGCTVANIIRGLFDQRAGHLAASFKECQRRDPVFDNIHDCFEILRGVSYVAGLKDYVDTHRDVISPLVVDNVDRALTYSLADVADASHTQTVLARAWLSLFDEVDVVICPAASVAPFAKTT